MSTTTPTLILKPISTLPMTVEIAIPPKRPVLQGSFVAHVKILSKPEFKELVDEELDDVVFFDRVVDRIEGLASTADPSNALQGQAALDEVKSGPFSQYLMPAVIQAYFEQYGEARRKNLPRSQRR